MIITYAFPLGKRDGEAFAFVVVSPVGADAGITLSEVVVSVCSGEMGRSSAWRIETICA